MGLLRAARSVRTRPPRSPAERAGEKVAAAFAKWARGVLEARESELVDELAAEELVTGVGRWVIREAIRHAAATEDDWVGQAAGRVVEAVTDAARAVTAEERNRQVRAAVEDARDVFEDRLEALPQRALDIAFTRSAWAGGPPA